MYNVSLTDAEWEVIKKLLDNQRKRKWGLRTQIFDGIFYVLKSKSKFWRLAKILADGTYRGSWAKKFKIQALGYKK